MPLRVDSRTDFTSFFNSINLGHEQSDLEKDKLQTFSHELHCENLGLAALLTNDSCLYFSPYGSFNCEALPSEVNFHRLQSQNWTHFVTMVLLASEHHLP